MTSNTPDAVSSEPRLFVGQVPPDRTGEELMPLFTPYGNVKSLHMVKGPDGRSRGCAMVVFERWGQAEAACEAHDGKTVLEGGNGRPLVVHFANPRRLGQGGVLDNGIAPKKLFVGQVPRTVMEEELRPLFEPYGELEAIIVHRKQGTQHAGCAFIQFKRWASAEAAMEAHHAKTKMQGSDAPLVVKFADARRRPFGPPMGEMGVPMGGMGEVGGYGAAAQLTGAKRGPIDSSPWPSDSKRQSTEVGAMGGPGGGYGAYRGPPAGGGYGADPAGTMAALGLGMGGMGVSPGGQYAPQQAPPGPQYGNGGPPGPHTPGGGMLSPPGAQQPSQQQAPGGPYDMQQQQQPGIAPVYGQQQQPGAHPGGPGYGHQPPPGQGPAGYGAMPPQGPDPNAAVGPGGAPPGVGPPGAVPPGLNPLAASAMAGNVNSLQSLNQLAAAVSVINGMAHDINRLGLMQLGGAAVGPGGVPPGGMMGPGGFLPGQVGKLGRGIGDGTALAWKLFIGQIPPEVTEQHLWPLFRPMGDILELHVLKTKEGRSRGCAFLTYEARGAAEAAAAQLDGHVMGSKRLVVKFADSRQG